jgi:hypothetical protein
MMGEGMHGGAMMCPMMGMGGMGMGGGMGMFSVADDVPAGSNAPGPKFDNAAVESLKKKRPATR